MQGGGTAIVYTGSASLAGGSVNDNFAFARPNGSSRAVFDAFAAEDTFIRAV